MACGQRDVDRYERMVAICRLDNEDISGWLISSKSVHEEERK